MAARRLGLDGWRRRSAGTSPRYEGIRASVVPHQRSGNSCGRTWVQASARALMAVRPAAESIALLEGTAVKRAELRAIYCQGGIRAALVWFVLHEVAGLTEVRN